MQVRAHVIALHPGMEAVAVELDLVLPSLSIGAVRTRCAQLRGRRAERRVVIPYVHAGLRSENGRLTLC